MTSPPVVTESDLRCMGCGYDLSGTAVGGVCPECGLPVRDSIAARVPGEKSCSTATTSMVLGILGLVACAPLGLVAIWLARSAKKEMSRGGYNQGAHTMAKAGMIMGIIATALLGFWVLVLLLGGFA